MSKKTKTLEELLEASNTLIVVQDEENEIYIRDKKDPNVFNKAEATICFTSEIDEDEDKARLITSVVKGSNKSIMNLWMAMLDKMRSVDSDCFSEIFERIGVGGGIGSPAEAITAVVACSNVTLSAAIGSDLLSRTKNDSSSDVGKSLDQLLAS